MVIPVYQEPPTPFLSSVMFSNDGSYLIALFNSPTDKGQLSSTFSCFYLFYFKGSSNSKCKWIDSVTVRVYSSGSLINIGSEFSLLPNVIKAQCTSSDISDCNDWSYCNNTIVTVSVPKAAISPSVVISAPSVVGNCDSFVLDLSGSLGSGGREWQIPTFIVNSADYATSAGLI
jgi:hypothetical protein